MTLMFQKEKDTERERGREGGRRQNKDIQGGRISKEGEERERRVEMRKERKKEKRKEERKRYTVELIEGRKWKEG